MKKTINPAIITIMVSIIFMTNYSDARQRKISAKSKTTEATKANTIIQAAKQLKRIQEDTKNAKTPAEKEKNLKDIIEATNYLLATIVEERSTLDDFRGYTAEQISLAEWHLKQLRVRQKEVEILLKKAQDKIAIFDDSGITGSKREHVAKKLNILEEILNQINTKIKDQEIITGKRYSNALRLALGVIGTGTVLTAGYYLGLGETASAIYQNPWQSMSDTWKHVKNTLTTKPSWLGGQGVSPSVWDILKAVHTITAGTIGTVGTFVTAWNYYKQLNELMKTMSSDPNADQELLKESIREHNKLTKKMNEFKENNPEEYKEALKKIKR